MVKVIVLFFASLRELTGTHKVEVELSTGKTNLKELVNILCDKYCTFDGVFNDNDISIAVNKKYLENDSPNLHDNIFLCDGDEVAFLPPISGG